MKTNPGGDLNAYNWHMGKHWDILGVGTAAVDDLLFVDHFPQPDEKMALRSKMRQGGGQTATALVAATRQGARTAFCAGLGDDELSRFTITELEHEGVDCSTVIKRAGSRPYHAFVIVDATEGSRTILYSSEGVQEIEMEAVDPAWISNSRAVFIDHNAPRIGLHAARLARQQQIPVIADLEKTSLPEMEALLEQIDHLIVNYGFAKKYTGKEQVQEMVRALSNPERAACVVTWGERGCWYSEFGQEVMHFPAFKVEVIDTTGCGDVFHGAYAAAITRGEKVYQAVQIASATAALKATRAGGRAGIPNLVTVERFLQEPCS